MDSLMWSATDAMEAGASSRSLEDAGCRVSKTQGYYTDEASVYRAEINRRLRDPDMGEDGRCLCCKR